MLPYSIDRQRTRRQPTGVRWKRPEKWFRFVIAAFSLNLFIAIVTVEQHINFSSDQATTSFKTNFIDQPRISPLSSRWKEKSKAQFSTESRIWHRMLLEQNNATNHQFLCNKNQTTTTPLPAFGFSETVRAYVRENESSKKGYCHAPPSEPSCQSLQYTVVIYSKGWNESNGDKVDSSNRYWRNIVIWAMKFMAYPSVQRVNLILKEEEPHNNALAVSNRRINVNFISDRSSTLEDAANRNKYAKRVLNWSKKGVVNVVSASSLWDAIDRLEVPSESVLWINGDHSVDSQTHVANNTVLNHRFHTWREAPNALVIPEETSLIPLQTIDNTKDSIDESTCSFPLLHEMMMHTNYLCYLNHPVVGSELRNYTKSLKQRINTKNDNTQNSYDNINLSWDITTMAVGMLLFSIGDGYVISDADTFSTTTKFASGSLLALHSVEGAMSTYRKDISNYFGCPCSMATPRLSPSNKRHCSSA